MKNADYGIYKKLRLVHHILCNATIFGVSLVVPILSWIVLHYLAVTYVKYVTYVYICYTHVYIILQLHMSREKYSLLGIY